MKIYFERLGIATIVFAWIVALAPTAPAQFLPPMVDDVQTEAAPDMQHPDADATPALAKNDTTSSDSQDFEGQTTNGDAKQPEPKLVQTLNATEAPQQVPGMNAYTILYFPPPTYPAPVPLTLYRPEMQHNQMPQMPMQRPMPQVNGQYPIGMAGGAAQMYAPPMIVQKQYIGPSRPGDDTNAKKGKGKRLIGRLMNRKPTEPGDPIAGPPVLVYPNGMVVKPKVYLPDQPFKNAIRAVTP